MKILYIILGVILLAFIIIQFFALNGQRNIETYPYVVNKKYKQKLKSALDAEGITYTNRFYFLEYNPLFEFFNRKNEMKNSKKTSTLSLLLLHLIMTSRLNSALVISKNDVFGFK